MIGVYVFGFFVHSWLIFSHVSILLVFPADTTPLPFMSVLYFFLMSAFICALYQPIAFAGAQTPAAIILTALEKKPKLTKQNIFSLFNEKLLIHKRIEDLIQVGILKAADGTFELTAKGKAVYFLIVLSTKFLGVTVGG